MFLESAMKNVLMELVDKATKSYHFIDATEADRDEIKSTLFNRVKEILKKEYNEILDDDYILAYLGDYLDVVADDIIKGDSKIEECDSFSTGVAGALGLANGIPQGGDVKGVAAAPIFTKKKADKKKQKLKVEVKRK